MVKIFRNPDVMWREEEELPADAGQTADAEVEREEVGTSVLFAGGTMLSINVLGTEIWKLCDGRSLDDLLAPLLEQFDVSEDVLRADVREFLDELAEKGFVTYEEQ